MFRYLLQTLPQLTELRTFRCKLAKSFEFSYLIYYLCNLLLISMNCIFTSILTIKIFYVIKKISNEKWNYLLNYLFSKNIHKKYKCIDKNTEIMAFR